MYEKPTCTTCRKLVKLLAEKGIEAERIDFHVLGLTRAQLDEIVAKTGLAPRELLRTREPEYKAARPRRPVGQRRGDPRRDGRSTRRCCSGPS